MPTVTLSVNDFDVELLPSRRKRRIHSPLASFRPSPPPAPHPSFARRLTARLLFVTVVGLVVVLGAAELSIALHEPRLDPRPLLAKGARAALAKIRGAIP